MQRRGDWMGPLAALLGFASLAGGPRRFKAEPQGKRTTLSPKGWHAKRARERMQRASRRANLRHRKA